MNTATATVSGMPMRFLVVEDEPDLLAAVAQALREEGYAVDESADGADGLAKAVAVPYDAVVLDLMLPKLDGWAILERLRSQDCRTPVLVLTARGTVADRIRGLDGGADDYLSKPFDIDELLARLRALVRRSVGVARAAVDVGDVRVDLTARTVTRDGKPVALTNREYAVVEHLALHAGTVVTRSALYEHVFDETDDSLSNLLDVHVFNVRRKLGKGFITTRRGHGYLIGEPVGGNAE
jgi:two-component system OmpR family response regulator